MALVDMCKELKLAVSGTSAVRMTGINDPVPLPLVRLWMASWRASRLSSSLMAYSWY